MILLHSGKQRAEVGRKRPFSLRSCAGLGFVQTNQTKPCAGLGLV